MFSYLTRICFAETDYPDAFRRGNETQYVQTSIKVADRYTTDLAIFFTVILEIQSRLEIKFRTSVKRKPAFTDVPLALRRIVSNFHETIIHGYFLIVATINPMSSTLKRRIVRPVKPFRSSAATAKSTAAVPSKKACNCARVCMRQGL
jgi:hypothetical protein